MRRDKEQDLVKAAAIDVMDRIRRDRDTAPLRIRDTLFYLEYHLFEATLDVNALKRVCGKRDHNFSSKFRKVLGVGPFDYITKARLETAERLLLGSRLSVQDIAKLTGFSNSTVLGRNFKARFGCTPTSYRRSRAAISLPTSAEAMECQINAETIRKAALGELQPVEMNALIRELESIYLVRAKLLAQTKPTLPQSIALDREEREMIEMHVAWEAIRDLSWREQRELIWDRLQHSTPLFFHFLRGKSISEGREDRMRGVQLAELALESLAVTEQISGRNAGSLRAQGLAWLGNARRLAFDFPGAEKAFSDAEAFLPDDNDEPLIVAEFYELKAAFRLWQRCFSEALALSGRALPIFRSYGNPKQLSEALVLKADIYYHSGDPEGAIPYLCEALDLSEASMVDGLESIIRYNLVSAFAKAGYYLEAAEILSAGEISSEGKFDCHRQWLEGFVEQGLCRVRTAERLFIEAREGFTKRRQVGYAALVALDLAVLYSEQGRDSEIPQLLLEAIPVFERLKCEREALAAVELLRDAVGKNKFPIVLLREVRDKIEQVRINPSSQFVARTAELCETGPNTRV